MLCFTEGLFILHIKDLIIDQIKQPKITGPEDYQKFYHMSSTGLVWLDKKGNPIPLLQLLDMHVETINPSELWNSIEMWNKVHIIIL